MKFMRIILALSLMCQAIHTDILVAARKTKDKTQQQRGPKARPTDEEILQKKREKQKNQRKKRRQKDIAQTRNRHTAPAEAQEVYTAPDVLVGDVITLRKPKEDDFEAYQAMYSANVREKLEDPRPIYTIDTYLQDFDPSQENKLSYHIFDNKDNKLIGSIDIDNSAEIDEDDKSDTDDISIWINENYRGGNRALEAVSMLLQIYFNLHPERTTGPMANVAIWNTPSLKLFQKAGFKEEVFYHNGEPFFYQLRYTRPKP